MIEQTPSRLNTSPLLRSHIGATPNALESRVAKILMEAGRLDRKSKYKCSFDYTVYKDLEERFSKSPIRGGYTFNRPFRLVNSHSTCQQCLYAFEIDTYGRGCTFNCAYCYAKAELTVHGYWNAPMPVPVDINEIRKVFYTVFETTKKTKWRTVLEKRIPIRIGSMTDSFMFMDTKFKVTQELLRILKFYEYPYIIFTRSDLVARDEYLNLLNPNHCAIQMSISSTNDELNKKLEPGAPSAISRLTALRKLSKHGFWTTVRINPLFPIYPDGYFTDSGFAWAGKVPKFEYSSFDMVDLIAHFEIPSLLVGFARLSSFALNGIQRATGFDLRPFYRRGLTKKSSRDWHYTDKEIGYYYGVYKRRCDDLGVQFTTCYIGNGEDHFWKFQSDWSNKSDCCNVKDRVAQFSTNSRNVPFSDRLKFTNHKDAVPLSSRLHDDLGILSVTRPQPTVFPA
jgi:hypothetical protein